MNRGTPIIPARQRAYRVAERRSSAPANFDRDTLRQNVLKAMKSARMGAPAGLPARRIMRIRPARISLIPKGWPCESEKRVLHGQIIFVTSVTWSLSLHEKAHRLSAGWRYPILFTCAFCPLNSCSAKCIATMQQWCVRGHVGCHACSFRALSCTSHTGFVGRIRKIE